VRLKRLQNLHCARELCHLSRRLWRDSMSTETRLVLRFCYLVLIALLGRAKPKMAHELMAFRKIADMPQMNSRRDTPELHTLIL
jgi:hypothetical protein